MKVDGFDQTIQWYDQNASTYAHASIQASSIQDKEQLAAFIHLLPAQAKILDAGCGSGRDTNFFSTQGFEAIGLDISKGLLAEARRRFPDAIFQEGDLRHLPFESETFDGLWAHASLLHLETFEEITQVLSEFNRVLKTKGILHVLVKAQTGSEKTAVVADALSGHDRFFQYFTKDELHQLLTDAGFSIIELDLYQETDRNPQGRPEVWWLVSVSRK